MAATAAAFYKFFPFPNPVRQSPTKTMWYPAVIVGLPLLPHPQTAEESVASWEGIFTKQRKGKGNYAFSMLAGPALLSFTLPLLSLLLLWGHQSNHLPGLGLPKEGQDRGVCPVILKDRPKGRSPQVPPPTRLLDALPHRFALGEPGPTAGEELVTDFSLPAAAPPAHARRDLLNPVGQAGPGRGVARKKLIIPSGYLLSLFPEVRTDAIAPRGPVVWLLLTWFGSSPRAPSLRLGRLFCQVGQAGPPQVPSVGRIPRSLCVLVR